MPALLVLVYVETYDVYSASRASLLEMGLSRNNVYCSTYHRWWSIIIYIITYTIIRYTLSLAADKKK